MSERTIFLNALDIADPAARSQFLDRECAGDDTLRRQVDALLTAHDGAGEFLEKPAIPLTPPRPEVRTAAAARASNDPTVAETRGPSDAGLGDRSLDASRTLLFEQGRATDGFPFLPPSHRADAIGRLSHYEILSPLGKGAFGSVFKAFDTRLDRIVAVKILAPELAASGGARKRFIREAKSAASVRHEHVVDIHAVDEEPIPYLVMECIIGQTLQQKLDRTGPLSVLEILRIGYQIATGLSAAHALGLIHRDIKPANILLENGVERVKITDFGLARAGDDASLTQSGIVCGTPMYMAPEQAQGEALDGRADLFSLGSTLYAMCTGRPPFRATTTMAVLKRVVEDHPRPIREINPEIPEWLCEIVDKLLAKNPAERFQSASEVAALFSQHLAHLQHPQTPAPPRVGRSRPEAVTSAAATARAKSPGGESDEEREEADSTLVGSLLVFLPIFSLLAMLLAAIRKGIPGILQEGPDDAARALMVLLGGLAASAGLFAWWFEGTTRRIASALAGAALLLAMGEGFRWIRVGEPVVPAIVSVPDSGKVSVVSSGTRRPTDETTSGRIDLLTAGGTQAVIAASPGASVDRGTLVLKHAGGEKPVVFRLDEIPFRNGVVRLRAVCLSREPDFALSLGVGHFEEALQRVDAALKATSAVEPVGMHLSRFDEASRTMTTTAIARNEPVEAGYEAELRMQVRDGNVWVHSGSAVPVNTNGGLLPSRDVVPYLTCKGSSWKILEWTLESEDTAGPVDLLNWGRFVNPTDLASLERAYDHAVIDVPGSQPFWLQPLPNGNLDAPRLLQEIEGDFEVSVAIPPYERPLTGTESRPEGNGSARGAGLLVWKDEKTFARFELSSLGEQEQGAPFLHAHWYVEGSPKGDERESPPDEKGSQISGPMMLKIHRWGNQLQLAWSRDGLTWSPWRTISNIPLGPRLQVGLFAENATNNSFKIRFDRFRLRGNELPDRSLARVPFDARQAAEWQAAAAREAGVPVEYKNSVGMTLRLIPAGEFTMGLAVEEINDVLKKPHQKGLDKGLLEFMTYANGPQHKVRLTRSYYVGATEVTVAQFRRFVEETGYQPSDPIDEKETPDWLKPSSEEVDTRPATKVTWHEARKFCRWLSEKEGVEHVLPTDAQWEFACRAGSAEKWFHGDDRDELKDYAWYGLGYHDAPRGVGEKKPNVFGLYDMLGNAHEWVQDWHQQQFYSESPQLDPVCTKPGLGRVCRGGWWWDSADLIRSASRSYNVPDVRYPGCGFRVAIIPPFRKLPRPAEPAAPAGAAESSRQNSDVNLQREALVVDGNVTP